MSSRLEELKGKAKALNNQIDFLIAEINPLYREIKQLERVLLKEEIVNYLRARSQGAKNNEEKHELIVMWAKKRTDQKLGNYDSFFTSDEISEILRELVAEGILKEHRYCGPPAYHGSMSYSLV